MKRCANIRLVVLFQWTSSLDFCMGRSLPVTFSCPAANRKREERCDIPPVPQLASNLRPDRESLLKANILCSESFIILWSKIEREGRNRADTADDRQRAESHLGQHFPASAGHR